MQYEIKGASQIFIVRTIYKVCPVRYFALDERWLQEVLLINGEQPENYNYGFNRQKIIITAHLF